MKEFFRRGFFFCWGGPAILAVIYAIHGSGTTLSGTEAARGILTITLLAFVAAGITVVYQIESLPLFPAIAIHGTTLYTLYLATYLINGWLEQGTTPFLIFTGIFIGGYAVIWSIIYILTVRSAKQINQMRKKTAG